jgi:hypothetical protein
MLNIKKKLQIIKNLMKIAWQTKVEKVRRFFFSHAIISEMWRLSCSVKSALSLLPSKNVALLSCKSVAPLSCKNAALLSYYVSYSRRPANFFCVSKLISEYARL